MWSDSYPVTPDRQTHASYVQTSGMTWRVIFVDAAGGTLKGGSASYATSLARLARARWYTEAWSWRSTSQRAVTCSLGPYSGTIETSLEIRPWTFLDSTRVESSSSHLRTC